MMVMENVDGKSSRLKCTKNVRKPVTFWIIICEIIILTLGQPSAGLRHDNVARETSSVSARSETLAISPEVSNANGIKVSEVENSSDEIRKDFASTIRSFVESELDSSHSGNLSERVLYLIKSNSDNAKSRKANHAQNQSEIRKLSLRAAQRPTRKLSHANNNVEFRQKFTTTPSRIESGNNFPNESKPNTISKVSLLGLFELTTPTGGDRWEGRSELAAAKLAVKHVNERGLLPGYVLELITNDTQVS